MNALTTSPISDFIRDAICGETIRVAVCGTENSGKTVFLTALANHLECHDTERDKDDGHRFDLGGDRSVSNFMLLTGEHGGKNDPIGEFPYEVAKQTVRGNKWPAATHRPTELAFSFDIVYPAAKKGAGRRLSCNDRRRHGVTLRLLDIPGERLADFLMAGKSFDDWSSAFLASSAGGVQEFRQWLQRLETNDRDRGKANDPDREEFFSQYATCIATAFSEKHCRYLSPSTVRITNGGEIFPNKETPDFATNLAARLGLDAEHRFIPLTKYWRERLPIVAKEFSRNYEAYKKEIVLPLTDWMKQSHCALLLVDVFAAYNGGRMAYDSAKAELLAALHSLHDPQAGIGTRLVNLFVRQYVPRDRIRVIVTKTDRADGNKSRDNLVSRARTMLGAALKDVFVDVPVEDAVLSCAAIQTHAGAGKRVFKVEDKQPSFSEVQGTMGEKGVNPSNFYTMEELAEEETSDRPPCHSDLDRVARFILDLPENV